MHSSPPIGSLAETETWVHWIWANVYGEDRGDAWGGRTQPMNYLPSCRVQDFSVRVVPASPKELTITGGLRQSGAGNRNIPPNAMRSDEAPPPFQGQFPDLFTPSGSAYSGAPSYFVIIITSTNAHSEYPRPFQCVCNSNRTQVAAHVRSGRPTYSHLPLCAMHMFNGTSKPRNAPFQEFRSHNLTRFVHT